MEIGWKDGLVKVLASEALGGMLAVGLLGWRGGKTDPGTHGGRPRDEWRLQVELGLVEV